MKTYIFSQTPNEQYKVFHLEDFSVYLNGMLLCTSTYSILLSHTVFGKKLYTYDINGKRIITVSLPIMLSQLSYTISSCFIQFTCSIEEINDILIV